MIFMMNSLNLYSLNLQTVENTRLFARLHKKLREDTWFKPILDYAEKSTKVNRVYLVSVTSVVLGFLLLAQLGTTLIAGCLGFLYPGYKTLSLLQHTYDVETGQKWLIYWFLYSALNFIEIFLFFLDWIPIYWLIKCFFLMWCYAPLQTNGADVVYIYLIQPFFQKNQEVIDNAINHMVRTAHSIYTESEPLAPLNAGRQEINQVQTDFPRGFQLPALGWISCQYGDTITASILEEIHLLQGGIVFCHRFESDDPLHQN